MCDPSIVASPIIRTYIVRYEHQQGVYTAQRFPILHICESQQNGDWRKKPLCRNGGINYRSWRRVDLAESLIPVTNICATCRAKDMINEY